MRVGCTLRSLQQFGPIPGALVGFRLFLGFVGFAEERCECLGHPQGSEPDAFGGFGGQGIGAVGPYHVGVIRHVDIKNAP
jgi:hypothetical protein